MLRLIIFSQVSSLTFSALRDKVAVGFSGVLVQAVIVPFIVMGLKWLWDREKHDSKE